MRKRSFVLRGGSGGERNARADASTYSRTLFSGRLLVANGAGDPARGLPLASEAVKLRTEAVCCHITHAKILATLGRHEAAKTAISDAFRCRPDMNKALIDVMFPHRDRSIPSQLAALLGVT